jgi:hypothetical protein
VPFDLSVERPFARRVFDDALSVVVDDQITSKTDRSAALLVLQFAALFVRFDEQLCSDVMNIVTRRLEDADVVRALLGTLRQNCRDREKLATAIARLAARAYRRGPRTSLLPIVLVALEVDEWREVLRDSWVHEVLAIVLEDGVSSIAATIIDRWIDAHETVPGWIRPIIQQRPKLLRRCGSAMAWRLHLAVPTAAGWRHMVSIEGTDERVSTEAFGTSLDEAVATLREAISTEPNDAARVILVSWLARLAG